MLLSIPDDDGIRSLNNGFSTLSDENLTKHALSLRQCHFSLREIKYQMHSHIQIASSESTPNSKGSCNGDKSYPQYALRRHVKY